MPHNLNISTVIDKNKVSSENVFLLLLEIFVVDHNGDAVETLRIVKNAEDITFESNTYTASNFELDFKLDSGSEPSIMLTAQDQTRQLAQYVDAYDGLIKNKIRIIIVNSGSLSSPAEIDELMIVKTGSVSNYVTTLELGIESALGNRFPNYRQFKDRCFKKFKGPRCQYAGADETCTYVRTGSNGCIAKNNEVNFGGFPGINELF
jgi:hypothetical protein